MYSAPPEHSSPDSRKPLPVRHTCTKNPIDNDNNHTRSLVLSRAQTRSRTRKTSAQKTTPSAPTTNPRHQNPPGKGTTTLRRTSREPPQMVPRRRVFVVNRHSTTTGVL
ncbi:unnamed protein product [Ectocarpus sp. 4 AP-2014]